MLQTNSLFYSLKTAQFNEQIKIFRKVIGEIVPFFSIYFNIYSLHIILQLSSSLHYSYAIPAFNGCPLGSVSVGLSLKIEIYNYFIDKFTNHRIPCFRATPPRWSIGRNGFGRVEQRKRSQWPEQPHPLCRFGWHRPELWFELLQRIEDYYTIWNYFIPLVCWSCLTLRDSMDYKIRGWRKTDILSLSSNDAADHFAGHNHLTGQRDLFGSSLLIFGNP